MTNILPFTGTTTVDQPPETVLERAKGWGMERCVILGYRPDGSVAFGGSFSDTGDILLLLELARQFVIDGEMGRL